MDGTSEKYLVCPHRNTTAAYRWFFEPVDALAFLKARTTPRPAAADLLAILPAPPRSQGR
jgi:hypothetical protein